MVGLKKYEITNLDTGEKEIYEAHKISDSLFSKYFYLRIYKGFFEILLTNIAKYPYSKYTWREIV